MPVNTYEIFNAIKRSLEAKGTVVAVKQAPGPMAPAAAGCVSAKCDIEITGKAVTFFINGEGKKGDRAAVHIKGTDGQRDRRIYQRKLTAPLPYDRIAMEILELLRVNTNSLINLTRLPSNVVHESSVKLVEKLSTDLSVPSTVHITANNNAERVSIEVFFNTLTEAEARKTIMTMVDLTAELQAQRL